MQTIFTNSINAFYSNKSQGPTDTSNYDMMNEYDDTLISFGASEPNYIYSPEELDSMKDPKNGKPLCGTCGDNHVTGINTTSINLRERALLGGCPWRDRRHKCNFDPWLLATARPLSVSDNVLENSVDKEGSYCFGKPNLITNMREEVAKKRAGIEEKRLAQVSMRNNGSNGNFNGGSSGNFNGNYNSGSNNGNNSSSSNSGHNGAPFRGQQRNYPSNGNNYNSNQQSHYQPQGTGRN